MLIKILILYCRCQRLILSRYTDKMSNNKTANDKTATDKISKDKTANDKMSNATKYLMR